MLELKTMCEVHTDILDIKFIPFGFRSFSYLRMSFYYWYTEISYSWTTLQVGAGISQTNSGIAQRSLTFEQWLCSMKLINQLIINK
jgi:hypothetical protein